MPDTLSNLSRLRKRYALAELKPSQTVLDFGSGGGIALIFTFQAISGAHSRFSRVEETRLWFCSHTIPERQIRVS